MADQAPVAFFIVGLRPVLPHPGKEGPGDVPGRGHGVGAGFRGNDGMGPGGVKAQHRLRRRAGAGQGGLVPVGPGILHPQGGKHFRLNAPDALKAVPHLLLLRLQGGFVAQMAAGAPAAAGINGAAGILPVRRWKGRGRFHSAEGIALFSLDDPHVRLLPGKKPGHEDGHAVQPADAFHIRPQVVRGQTEDFIFLHTPASFCFPKTSFWEYLF